MKANWIRQGLGLLLGIMLGATTILATRSVSGFQTDAPPVESPAVTDTSLATTYLLNYQGRLLAPDTGLPKADGSYTMTFRLYTAATGGTALWTETKDVVVTKGLFVTLLGDVTPLNLTAFNGQDLWLGVKVGSDDEAAPRQRVSFVAYALYAQNAATAATAATAANATNANNANSLDGFDSTAFYKGNYGVQVNQTTPLAAGGQQYWFTFGYSTSQLVVWQVRPTSNGAKLKLEVETEYVASNNTYTYWLRVYNTGTVESTYQLVRFTQYQ